MKKHHRTSDELLVRCYKVHAKHRGLTYRGSVDEASFSTRFTPRKPKSKWSAVNIRRAQELEVEGRMHQSGRTAFRARDRSNSTRYSFEEKPSTAPGAKQSSHFPACGFGRVRVLGSHEIVTPP